jgi:hypothetical protein
MGFNATVVVLLDQLDRIENDPEFGKKLGDAIRAKANRPKLDHQYVTGQTQVIEVHHADYQVVVAVGGNTGRVIGNPVWYTSTDDQIVKWLNGERLERQRAAKSQPAAQGE